MAPLPAGTQLDGRYEILKVLGEGGMATVYQVRHLGLHSLHALKALNPELAVHDEVRARFLSEGRIQAKLRHPNIVQVTEIVTSPVAGLVMEYVEGPTLAEYIRQHGPIRNLENLLGVFGPILDGVGEAHAQGVVHRDLKPENILLGRDSRGQLQPRITDFGIAHISEGGSQRTRAGARMGTLHYMSPEQVHGAEWVDARSDIFSLGAILYELLTGQRAFEGKSEFDVMASIVEGKYPPATRFVPTLPDALVRCIQRALSVAPDQRFPSCTGFQDALKAAAARIPVAQVIPTAPVVKPPVPEPATQRPRTDEVKPRSAPRTSRKPVRRWVAMFGVMATLGWLGGMGIASWQSDSAAAGGAGAVRGGHPVAADAGRGLPRPAEAQLPPPVTNDDGGSLELDKTEVTVNDYRSCVKAGSCTPPGQEGYCNWGHPGRGVHPINCVDWEQARAFCAWIGKRLPSEEEWKRAATNGGKTTYPWGDTPPHDRLVHWSGGARMSATAEVGTHPAGATLDGLQDMAGNVREWTADAHPTGESRKIVLGGCWASELQDQLQASLRDWVHVSARSSLVGFRCAR